MEEMIQSRSHLFMKKADGDGFATELDTLIDAVEASRDNYDQFIVLMRMVSNLYHEALWCESRISSLPLPRYVVKGD